MADEMVIKLDGFELDYKLPLNKSPKHISMIKICPKKRKRGDYVIVHLLLKKLEIPTENDSQVNEETQRFVKNIFEIEVKPLLKELVKRIPIMAIQTDGLKIFSADE
jgi:hypothetical protein